MVYPAPARGCGCAANAVGVTPTPTKGQFWLYGIAAAFGVLGLYLMARENQRAR